MVNIGNIGIGLAIVIFVNWVFSIIVPSIVKSVIILGVDITGFLRSAMFTILNLFWLMVLTSASKNQEA